ncbi:toll/interleukin-1 receptor domain-containing protein [Thalassospira sp. MCCC 1A02491]|uniref:toll/interleukin-1 receptor domain-containing protein n=1 Tax=Thalassospira sp. MCCC 1A02491 TaxID=1769751 RepID=UPI0007AD7246|nr:toll/interleukin-1 receptor domain-containing protein [Thalassospira sp. MCCC 1A02491]KZB69316.1 hypothetical protein AUQ42_10750 [Thalassospira sp. MCCC 1A02491]
MINVSIRDRDFYEENKKDFELIGVFEKTIQLAIIKNAWSQSNAVALIEDASFELIPHYYFDFGQDNPRLSIDVYIDDNAYLENSHNVQNTERSVEVLLESVIPRRLSIPLDISLFPKSFLNANDSHQWRSNPQYHFREALQTVSPEMVENIWGTASSLHVFISHKADKKKRAHKLKEGLSRYGISSFVAHDDIKPAEEWQVAIEKALFSSDALIALICDEFSASDWTDQEVGIAIGRQIPIFPVKLSDTANPYGFIGKIQAFKVTPDTLEDFISRLLSDQRTSTTAINSLLEALKSTEEKSIQNNLLKQLVKSPKVSWSTKAITELTKIGKSKKLTKSSKEFKQLQKLLKIEAEDAASDAPSLDDEIPF